MIYEITKEQINGLTGEAFENLVHEFYETVGFFPIKTPITNDYGSDLIVPTVAGKVSIQCKRQTSTVGIKAVQEVFASMKKYGANSAKIITTSGFSSNAVELAKCCGVDLIDGDMFWNDFILPVQNEQFVIKEKKRYLDEMNKLSDKALEYDSMIQSNIDKFEEIKSDSELFINSKMTPYISDLNNLHDSVQKLMDRVLHEKDSKSFITNEQVLNELNKNKEEVKKYKKINEILLLALVLINAVSLFFN
ncbi:MAG: restriction endonuclease [Fusobacteriaceae bacterium]